MEQTLTLDLLISSNEIARREQIKNIHPFILKNPLNLSKIQLHAVVQQHEFLEKAADKLGEWAVNFQLIGPPGVSLEQSSSEISAKLKADILGESESFIDLTGGFGVDTYYFSRKAQKGTYVEQNELLAAVVAYNFRQMGVSNVAFLVGSAEDIVQKHAFQYDWVYLDPARRSATNEKLVRVADLSPNVIELAPEIWKMTDQILVKLSPMLDLKQVQREVPHIQEIRVIGIKNEVKEVLLLLKKDHLSPPKITTLNYVHADKIDVFSFTFEEEERTFCRYDSPLHYIYEPNACILKSGAFQQIGVQFDLAKLAKHTHLYTSNTLHTDFPGRIFAVQELLKPKKDVLQKHLGKPLFAHVIARNFGENAEKIAHNFQIKSKDETTYLLFTQLQDNKKVAIHANKIKVHS